jgi:hypothetical protein
MPYISDKKKIGNELLDRMINLIKSQKAEIKGKYFHAKYCAKHGILHEAVSQRTLAKEYGVSRRTIVFVLFPERLEENYKLRVKRGGSKRYYDQYGKEKWAKTMREHRRYKNELYKLGLIK